MQRVQEREGAPPPSPGSKDNNVYSPAQMKSYLSDLRTNRPARPTGSRPPPKHFNTWSSRAGSRMSADLDARPMTPTAASASASASASAPTVPRAPSPEKSERVGRPLARPPRADSPEEPPTAVGVEGKVFESARDEAAELVWKHRNPQAIPSPSAPYAYPGPGRKKTAPRSRSIEPKDPEEAAAQDLQRTLSKRKRHSLGSDDAPAPVNTPGGTAPAQDAIAKAESDLADSTRRKTSGSRRKASGSLFHNPNDQIYEEPDEARPATAPAPTPASDPPRPSPLPLRMRRNPFTRFQSVKGNTNMPTTMARAQTDPIVPGRRFDRYEIQKNEPTQSRNAAYTLNRPQPKPVVDTKADAENEPAPRMKDGKEIRSDELRAATKFSLRDRSPKLPTPTMVSDSPGRPIVSFQKDWNVVELKEEVSKVDEPVKPRPLSKAMTAPVGETSVERPPSRSATSGMDRPPSRSGGLAGAERPPSRSAASPVTARPSSPSTGRPSSPALRFNRGDMPLASPLRKVNTPATAPSPYDLPSRPNPYDLTPSSSRPKTPVTSSNSTNSAPPPIPSISVSESPAPGRGRFAKTASTPAVPTISVGDASGPPVPSISVSESPARGRFNKATSMSNIPTISVGEAPVPSISVNESPARGRFNKATSMSNIPTIAVNEPPSISINGSGSGSGSRPSPSSRFNKAPSMSNIPTIAVNDSSSSSRATPNAPSARPLPDPAQYAKKPFNRNSHWTPTTHVRTGAQCTQCALPIAGRTVSAAGLRFHPECFTCYQCGEHLECVAFYPEPETAHSERTSRIHARQSGHDIPFLPTHPTPSDMARLESEDGPDTTKRFFCALDYHELFSPRCKSCKTPIEGEVIVACGAEWHAGHFFCAQCGDPFDSSTPFVEKDGYAWCVGCHTNRYSAKCKGCRKPVVDTVVKALGAEWHQGCFCCMECSGPFEDGRYFLRGEARDPVCVRCEERRLKA